MAPLLWRVTFGAKAHIMAMRVQQGKFVDAGKQRLQAMWSPLWAASEALQKLQRTATSAKASPAILSKINRMVIEANAMLDQLREESPMQ